MKYLVIFLLLFAVSVEAQGGLYPSPAHVRNDDALQTLQNTNRKQSQQSVSIKGEGYVTHKGIAPYSLISAASTNATLIRAGKTWIKSAEVFNNTDSIKYLKFYNKATAPDVGTDVPVKTWLIPAYSGLAPPIVHPYYFPLGLGIAITTGGSVSDTGAVGANEVFVNFQYADYN